MAAIKRIPVSPEILEELSRLKEPEQTFGELIAGMIEMEKKFRLLKDMKRIEESAEFAFINKKTPQPKLAISPDYS